MGKDKECPKVWAPGEENPWLEKVSAQPAEEAERENWKGKNAQAAERRLQGNSRKGPGCSSLVKKEGMDAQVTS